MKNMMMLKKLLTKVSKGLLLDSVNYEWRYSNHLKRWISNARRRPKIVGKQALTKIILNHNQLQKTVRTHVPAILNKILQKFRLLIPVSAQRISPKSSQFTKKAINFPHQNLLENRILQWINWTVQMRDQRFLSFKRLSIRIEARQIGVKIQNKLSR